MDVCLSLLPDAQSAKALKPNQGALDGRTPSAGPFIRLDTYRAIHTAIHSLRSQTRFRKWPFAVRLPTIRWEMSCCERRDVYWKSVWAMASDV